MAVLPSFYSGGHGEFEPECVFVWLDGFGLVETPTGKLHWDQVVKRLNGQVVSFFFSFLLLAYSLMSYYLILLCHFNATIT